MIIIIPPCNMQYAGTDSPELDAPVTKAEVFVTTQTAHRNSAAGSDKITNSMVRNLSNAVLKHLTLFLNEQCLEKGQVPPDWKEAKVYNYP